MSIGKPLAKRGGRITLTNTIAIYEYLNENSNIRDAKDLQEYGYPAQEGEQIRVFEGYVLVSVEKSLGLRASAVTQCLSMLKAMNAVTLLVTGNRVRRSIYLLHYQPTEEQYEEFMGRSYAIERKTIPSKYDSLINDLVVIRQRLDVVERELAELKGNQYGGHNIRGSQPLS